MIHLAYDGSINGDWVAWYALNLARHDPERALRVIYIDTAEFEGAEVRAKADAFIDECTKAGIKATFESHASSGPSVEDVFHDLLAQVPDTPDTLLVCGARLKSEAEGYLAGTVSEKLLGDTSFNVMAVRVVQPGLLGAPRRFLVPVAGDRKGFLTGAGILKRFGADIARIHLLRVMMLKRRLFRRLLNNQAQSLREKGWASMEGLNDDLAQCTGVEARKFDMHVAVSDDWAQEVIISANRHKIHLILMEAAWKDLRATYRYGNPIEVVLRNAPCDVAVYRGV